MARDVGEGPARTVEDPRVAQGLEQGLARPGLGADGGIGGVHEVEDAEVDAAARRVEAQASPDGHHVPILGQGGEPGRAGLPEGAPEEAGGGRATVVLEVKVDVPGGGHLERSDLPADEALALAPEGLVGERAHLGDAVDLRPSFFAHGVCDALFFSLSLTGF